MAVSGQILGGKEGVGGPPPGAEPVDSSALGCLSSKPPLAPSQARTHRQNDPLNPQHRALGDAVAAARTAPSSPSPALLSTQSSVPSFTTFVLFFFSQQLCLGPLPPRPCCRLPQDSSAHSHSLRWPFNSCAGPVHFATNPLRLLSTALPCSCSACLVYSIATAAPVRHHRRAATSTPTFTSTRRFFTPFRPPRGPAAIILRCLFRPAV
ncbi:uncharacterized protein BDZ99DRAFT_154792 [Mytilinidion resinicola]|uniref:Uncharacterized protein n=1 Tax=Mytilinidion resinicola TaxID=574789 RepID=A0A6A6Y702_9PEZI|nr:uncharacterized protein BDZ99DRAFT_154792 [Mytilinidion resinicola]KAF2804308.1 hypothetical protein BDZ99DRAFT_154792 [Mytilinidion resinicola]